jgi:diguanylate cyclase (GGDEF)-like protein
MDERRKQIEGTEESSRLSKNLRARHPAYCGTAALQRVFAGGTAERKRLESQLLHLATHDPLTDLFNRQYLQEALERQLAQSRRYGTVGALLILDVDQFQDINKSLGHFAGDEVLGSLAGMLRKQVRESDLVARPGGDRFAILLQHTDEHQTAIVARHLLEAVQSHTVVNIARQFGVTATIGIVLVPKHGATSGELLARAEIALSQARGRLQQVAVYTPDRDGKRVAARLNWRTPRQALEKGLFFLEAQPSCIFAATESPNMSCYCAWWAMEDESYSGTFLGIAERSG